MALRVVKVRPAVFFSHMGVSPQASHTKTAVLEFQLATQGAVSIIYLIDTIPIGRAADRNWTRSYILK